MNDQDVTGLLEQWRNGSESARDQLLTLIYRDLKNNAIHVARRLLYPDTPNAPSPTTILHDAMLRVFKRPPKETWHHRSEFFALAQQAMIHYLIDFNRKNRSARGGGGAIRISLEVEPPAPEDEARFLLDLPYLQTAMGELEMVNPVLSQVIDLRFFQEKTVRRTAQELSLSEATIFNKTNVALAWLKTRMDTARQPQATGGKTLGSLGKK